MTEPDTAAKRPPIDHPVRKAIYALAPLSDIRRGINEAALETSALIAELRRVDTDPATWDEVIQLRRDLRVAEMQLDHAVRAAQDWSRRAANDAD